MNKPLCLISGPVFNRSGYGDWATSIAKSIIRYDKFDVKNQKRYRIKHKKVR